AAVTSKQHQEAFNPNKVSDFTTPVIRSTVNESLKNILLDKMEKSKSYQCALVHKELYDALDKDEDPPAGSDQGLEKLKTSKDVEPPKGPKSNESKSSSSKCTKFHPKSSRKSIQEEEPVFKISDSEMPQDQGSNLGNIENQLNVKATSKHDWFEKPKRPLTPDPDWNAGKSIDFRPP
ncbi:hypothetical protein Tco_1390601, partial [Tanacetum coccineum]